MVPPLTQLRKTRQTDGQTYTDAEWARKVLFTRAGVRNMQRHRKYKIKLSETRGINCELKSTATKKKGLSLTLGLNLCQKAYRQM